MTVEQMNAILRSPIRSARTPSGGNLHYVTGHTSKADAPTYYRRTRGFETWLRSIPATPPARKFWIHLHPSAVDRMTLLHRYGVTPTETLTMTNGALYALQDAA